MRVCWVQHGKLMTRVEPLLQLFNQIYQLERKPPVTLAVMAACFATFFDGFLPKEFTRLVPSIVAVLGYVVAFWLLSICLRSIPTGVVYALWSGMGIVFITAVAWVVYQQKLDGPALLGLALILAGVAVINLFSKAVNH